MSSSRSPVHRIVLLTALALGAVGLAPPVQAQSCSTPSLVQSSYPADGATGVPTNSPLYAYGSALAVGNSDITLQDEDGEEVSIEVTAVDGGLFIDAFLGFAPNTTYSLTVAPRDTGEAWSATFTTGTGPALPVEIAAPDVDVSVIDQDTGSCGVVSAICVNGSVPARMTFEILVGDEVVSHGAADSAPAFLANNGNVAASDCIEIRVREPGGFVSDSTRFCGAELARFELAENVAAPRSCEPYRSDAADTQESAAESSGCALGASSTTPSASGLLISLSALFLARQRKRAR